jgi:GNAT superfamily N-acetyltransferase
MARWKPDLDPFGIEREHRWGTDLGKKKKPSSGGGRTPSEAGLAESMAAAGYEVSPTNLPSGVSSGSTPYPGPGGSGRSRSVAGPPAPTPHQRLTALRKKSGKAPPGSRASGLFDVSAANPFKSDVGKELKQLQKGMKSSGTIRKEIKRETDKKINRTFNEYAREFNARNEYERNAFRGAFSTQKSRDLFVSELYEADRKEVEKRPAQDGGVVADLPNPFKNPATGKRYKPPVRRRQIRNIAKMSPGKEVNMPSETQAKFDADQLVGQMVGLDLTPVDLALMFAGPLKSAKGLKAMKALTAAEKAADPALTTANAFAKGTKTGKAISGIQKVTRSPKYKQTRINVGKATVAGAAAENILGPGYTGDFVEGTAKGFIDDPGKTLETSARGLVSGVTFPFTAAGNVGLTAKRALYAPFSDSDFKSSPDYITAPVERLKDEMLFEAKRMIDVYTSGDIDKIAKATQEDYGLLNAMGAGYMLRPFMGKFARSTGRKTIDSKAGGAIALPTLERNWNKKKLDWYASRVFGRAEGESNHVLGKVTREWRESAEKINRQPGIQAVYKKQTALREAEIAAATKGMTPEQAKVVEATITPISLADKIGWVAHKKLQPGPNLLERVAEISRTVDPGTEDARVANAILNTPELFDGKNRGLTAAVSEAWAKARKASKIAQDAWEDTVRLQARTPEEAARIIAEQRRAEELEANITYGQLTGRKDPIRPEAIGAKELAAADAQVLTGLKGTVANRRAALAKAEKQLKIKKAKLDTRDARERIRLQNEERAIKAEIDKVNAEGRQQVAETAESQAKIRLEELKAEAETLRAERAGVTEDSGGATDYAAKRAELDAEQAAIMREVEQQGTKQEPSKQVNPDEYVDERMKDLRADDPEWDEINGYRGRKGEIEEVAQADGINLYKVDKDGYETEAKTTAELLDEIATLQAARSRDFKRESMELLPGEKESIAKLQQQGKVSPDSLDMDRVGQVAIRAIETNDTGITAQQLPIGAVWRDQGSQPFVSRFDGRIQSDVVFWQKVSEDEARQIDYFKGPSDDGPIMFDDGMNFIPEYIGLPTGLRRVDAPDMNTVIGRGPKPKTIDQLNEDLELKAEAETLRAERAGVTEESAGVTDYAAKRAELDAEETRIMEDSWAINDERLTNKGEPVALRPVYGKVGQGGNIMTSEIGPNMPDSPLVYGIEAATIEGKPAGSITYTFTNPRWADGFKNGTLSTDELNRLRWDHGSHDWEKGRVVRLQVGAVSPEFQRKGVASMLLEKIRERFPREDGWKIETTGATIDGQATVTANKNLIDTLPQKSEPSYGGDKHTQRIVDQNVDLALAGQRTIDQLNEELGKISKRRRTLDSMEQFDKNAARQKPGTKRQEEIAARLKEIEEEKTVQRNERDKAKRAFKEEGKKIRTHEKRIKDLYVKPDPRLEPLRAHVQELKGRKEAAAKRVAAAVENTQAFQDEIAFRLTPAERKAAVRRVDEKLGTGPDYAKIDALEAELRAADAMSLSTFNIQQRLNQERGKGVKAGQTAATKVAGYDSKLRRLQEERDSLPEGEARQLVIDEIAAITQERKVAVMDNSAALRTAEIRATIQMAEGAKKEARLREYRKQFEVVFDEFNRQAREADLMGSGFFITGNEAKDPGIPSGNPGFNSVFGSPAPQVKTGGLSRAGTVDRSQKAFFDTVRKVNDALANTRKSQWLMSAAVARHTTGKNKGKVIVDSKAGFARRVKNGEVDPTGKVLLNKRMLTDPANLGPISRAVDAGDGKVRDGIREITPDDAAKHRSDEDILTDRLAAEGEGDMYVLVDEGPLKIEAHMKDMPHGVTKAFYELNRLTSRVVLGTSPTWALMQPIAELLVQVVDNPNPKRLIRSYREAAANRRNPDTSVARGQAHLAGTSVGIAREYSNAKVAQKDINAALKAEREYPGWRFVRETLKAEQLGKFDRWKGSLIREAGLIAELDRELSTLRRTAKAIQGNYDAIEQASGILMKMNRAEQIKWLNSRDGMEAGQLLFKNLDELYGNWNDLKPGWEREIGTIVFFYPFVRFSLDWTLRTFPKRHPVRWQLAQMFGQFQAETLERLMAYDPRWMNDWAVGVLYGGPDGDPTMLAPLSRTSIAGNTVIEAGFSEEGDLVSNLAKSVVPLISGAPRIFLGEKDQYGNPLTDPDDEYGEIDPSMKTKVGQWIEEVLLLSAPVRETLRETGYSPKEIVQGEQDFSITGFFGNAPGREPKAGDDPNLTRDRIRRNLFPLTPEPIQQRINEQKLDRLYRAREDAQTTARGEYPRVTFRGRKNQSLYDVGRTLAAERKAQEAEGLSGEPRTPRERELAKQYIELSGMNKYGSDKVDKINRAIVKYAEKIGAPLPEDSTIKQEVTQARYDDQDQVKEKYLQRWGGTEYPGYRQAKKMLAQTGNAGDAAGDGLSDTPRTKRVPLSGGGYTYAATKPGYEPKTPLVTAKNQPANTPPADRIPVGTGIEPITKIPRKRQVALAKKIRKAKVRAFAGGRLPLEGQAGVFVNTIARETGLSSKVIGAWYQAEGGNQFGDWNVLNVGHTDDGPIGLTGDAGWSNPKSAAKLTAEFMKGNYGGPSDGIMAILNYVGKSDEEQLAAIANSGWATNADYASLLQATYAEQPDPLPANNKKAKQEWKRLVERGQKLGVYEVPGNPITIKTHPGEAGTKGDWSGGETIMEQALRGTGIEVSSEKRAADDPLSIGNPGSDHNEANTSAYAVDLPATGERGMEIAAVMHKRLGLTTPLDQLVGTFDRSESSKYPGYSFQLLWEVDGHYDHVHIGVNTHAASPAGSSSQGRSQYRNLHKRRRIRLHRWLYGRLHRWRRTPGHTKLPWPQRTTPLMGIGN